MELDARLRAIARQKGARLLDLGAEGEPFWQLDIPGDTWAICLASGIHGDEPAGVEALLRFLEGPLPKAISWTVFPVMNPVGLRLGVREDAHGHDPNRLFDVPHGAVALFERAVDGRQWNLYVDLHEDDRMQGFYTLEIETERAPLGPLVVSRLRTAGHPIEPAERLWPLLQEEGVWVGGIEDGVVLVDPEAMPDIGLPQAPYMALSHAEHVLTLETPARAKWEARVQMHRMALSVVIETYTGISL